MALFETKKRAGEHFGRVPVTANVPEMLSLLHKLFRESVYLSELVLCTRYMSSLVYCSGIKELLLVCTSLFKNRKWERWVTVKKDGNLRFA